MAVLLLVRWVHEFAYIARTTRAILSTRSSSLFLNDELGINKCAARLQSRRANNETTRCDGSTRLRRDASQAHCGLPFLPGCLDVMARDA